MDLLLRMTENVIINVGHSEYSMYSCMYDDFWEILPLDSFCYYLMSIMMITVVVLIALIKRRRRKGKERKNTKNKEKWNQVKSWYLLIDSLVAQLLWSHLCGRDISLNTTVSTTFSLWLKGDLVELQVKLTSVVNCKTN